MPLEYLQTHSTSHCQSLNDSAVLFHRVVKAVPSKQELATLHLLLIHDFYSIRIHAGPMNNVSVAVASSQK